MIVRTAFIALGALALATLVQSASAQQATPPPLGAPTTSAQANQTTAVETQAVLPDASTSAEESFRDSATVQCRWRRSDQPGRRSERSGFGVVMIPLDMLRDFLNAGDRASNRTSNQSVETAQTTGC